MIDWNTLAYTCQFCQKCALADSRNHVIFGTGNPRAQVLVVGRVPTLQDDYYGQAFTGPEGQMLDTLLSIIDLDRRTNVYMTNLVKCCPPKQRNLLTTEQRACLPVLQHQIALIRPKVLLCLGTLVAKLLIHPHFNMDKEHGVFFQQDGIERMAIYEPTTLLCESQHKPTTFDDLKKLERKIREIAPETYLSGENTEVN